MTTLMSKILNILQPSIPALLTNPHASPPLRLLLIILTPTRTVPALNEAEEGKGGIIRSKKSGKYRKGQAVQGKSIFGDEEEKGKGKASARSVPEELVTLKKDILDKLLKDVSEVEWRSMGVHAVGSAAVQLLLELETEDQTAGLLDILTDGLVSQIRMFLLSLHTRRANSQGTNPKHLLRQRSTLPPSSRHKVELGC